MRAVLVCVSLALGTALLWAQTTPPPIASSGLVVRLDEAGRMPAHANPTSPVAAGSSLLLIDQTGFLYRWNGADSSMLLSPGLAPSAVALTGVESLLNVAADAGGSALYVLFTSTKVPAGIPTRVSPRPGADAWQVLYRYDFNGNAVTAARPIAAWQVRLDGHTGGGLAVLPDGSALAATGDNGDAFEDGRAYAADPSNHLSKLLHISPADGTVTVAAVGVRNVQRLALYGSGPGTRIDFVDIGGNVAEELNSIPLAELLAGSPLPHFGWGRDARDDKAREGLFYIDAGGRAVGAAPVPEPGFHQPAAQFGREGAQFYAASGPVSSTRSFTHITSLFADLVSGACYAITGAPGDVGQPVYHVGLVNGSGQAVTLLQLAGGERPDPRFFNFPDGTAGVLLERTGTFYRLTETAQSTAPAPALVRAAPPPNAPRTAPAPAAPARRSATVVRTSAPLVIDGVLDEPAWARAQTLTDFYFPWGDAERRQPSEVKLLWDATGIYVGARMSDTHIAAAGRTVDTMYDDDMFEIHFAPDPAHAQVFFLYEGNLNHIVNAQVRGALPNGQNDWYDTWAATTLRAATTTHAATSRGNDGFWTLELRIPFTAFRVPDGSTAQLPAGWQPAVPPKAGDHWLFNFARSNHDGPGTSASDYSLWSFTGHYAYGPGKDNMHFHDQHNFGEIVFGGA